MSSAEVGERVDLEDERVDLEELRARLSSADVSAYYTAKADTGIDLGPSFRTLERGLGRAG